MIIISLTSLVILVIIIAFLTLVLIQTDGDDFSIIASFIGTCSILYVSVFAMCEDVTPTHINELMIKHEIKCKLTLDNHIKLEKSYENGQTVFCIVE